MNFQGLVCPKKRIKTKEKDAIQIIMGHSSAFIRKERRKPGRKKKKRIDRSSSPNCMGKREEEKNILWYISIYIELWIQK